MALDETTLKKISEAALGSSDPGKAETNLQRFFEQNPGHSLTDSQLTIVSGLFSASQFLANYSIFNPDELYSALAGRKKELTKRLLKERALNELLIEDADIDSIMKTLRIFKKRYLLLISIRDITGESDIRTSMDELTFLSEIIIEAALNASILLNRAKFGQPDNSAFTIIALGKLGGEELNYSSDIDIIAVYDNDEGQTSGVPNPSGITYNKISTHEFFCRVVELFSKLLTSQTEDGIAYRVDLRLRPQGQKGEIALPLKAYRTYYESWGRTWERMVLIRARPVAGNMELGNAFLETIKPFVWRDTLDFTEVEEIRGLKKRIDSAFSRNDIKRGYGGIREAEFFVQTFQLLYAGTNPSLKSYRILNAIQALKWMKIIPEDELTTLWENYLYLRQVEQYLQMKEDLQTHTLPTSDKAMDALAKIMGFSSTDRFLAGLQLKRMQIKNMYNSLLGTQEDVHAEMLNLIEGDLNDEERLGYLSFRGVRDPDKCLANMKKIRDHMRVFQTMQERSIARQVIPLLVEDALAAESKDRAMAGLEHLFTTYGIKTAHLTALLELKEMMTGIIKIFSLSSYLTRIFLSDQYYINILIEKWSIFKTLKETEANLERVVEEGKDINSRLARFRRLEELRLGMLFLQGIIKTDALSRDLSYLAEAIIRQITGSCSGSGLAVVALGKLGGREMTFGSDLDIIFISETREAAQAAEQIIKSLTAYTDMGLLYSVDARLRPDGARGFLVKDIEGYRNYYVNSAQNWEIQALLKARPVGGDESTGRLFMDMIKKVILERGGSVQRSDISAMRERIIKKLSHESDGIDIKLGPGGIEEIEFFVQFMQLNHAGKSTEVLVQNTPAAIDRLTKKNVLSAADKSTLTDAYKYYRKLETLMRLNEEQFISGDSEATEVLATFMGHRDKDEFMIYLKSLREKVLSVTNKY